MHIWVRAVGFGMQIIGNSYWMVSGTGASGVTRRTQEIALQWGDIVRIT